ncbi:MAG TPA: GntR family transcriptional regulator [Actinocrinis sp.]|nr:GntR family transcriptional regulator [Actinocrinis sp.]
MYVEGWNAHRVVRPSRLANAVIERLLLRILDGEFQAEGDLPPEAALAQEFAVSRTILREALKALEEKRVLRIRHGRGTTVRPKADWNILDPMVLGVLLEYGATPSLPADLDEVRTAMQLLMADLAATRSTAEQRERMGGTLTAMRTALPSAQSPGDPAAYREAAHHFAAALAAAAGNEVARCVVETIDVPFAAEDPERQMQLLSRTHDLAEQLYARVAGDFAPPAAEPAAEPVEAAEPGDEPVNRLGHPPVPAQSPLMAGSLRRRAGDLRGTMAGVGGIR